MVFLVIGWILLGLLALLLLVLVLPASVTVQFSHKGLFIWARVLFVRVKVFPFKTRPQKPRREKKAKAKIEPEGDKKGEKPQTFGEKYARVKRLSKAGMAAARVVLRHLRFRAVQVVVPVHSQDASDTAVMCGRVQAGIGTLRAALDGRLNVRFKRIQIIPDFAGQMQDEYFFACKVVCNPVIMFNAGFVFFKHFLRKRPYSRAVYKRALAQKRARAKVAKTAGGNAA